MVEPLRHRQTKEAATDMFYLKPPRHISTLPMFFSNSGIGCVKLSTTFLAWAHNRRSFQRCSQSENANPRLGTFPSRIQSNP